MAQQAPASFKYAIFDLDGTLIDYEGASHVGLAQGLKAALPPEAMTWELHGSIIGTRAETWAPKLLAALGVPPEKLTPEQYLEAYGAEMEGLYSGLQPMRGAVELVERLAALGVRMAIATSSERSQFDKKMAYHERILSRMEAVVTGDDPAVKQGKPAPDIFLEAARRLGARPEECAVFEDAPSGVAAGRAAGAYTVAIPDPRFQGGDFSPAHRVLSSLEEWTAELPTPT